MEDSQDTVVFEILPPYLQGPYFQSFMLIQVQLVLPSTPFWKFNMDIYRLTTPVANHLLNDLISPSKAGTNEGRVNYQLRIWVHA